MAISRSRTALAAAVLATFATLTTAVTGTAHAAEQTHRAIPAHVFAPYFQSYNPGDPATYAAESGARYLTMAFLQTVNPGDCTVTWNGATNAPVAWSTYGDSFARLRAMGGDVIASFGGGQADGNGTDIADSCTDVAKIAAVYENIVTTYGISRIDLDVEGASAKYAPGIDRRDKAIHEVEQWAASTGRRVEFEYTIPTNVHGLDPSGVTMLQNAVANGARIDVFNIMTFDYYDNNPHEMAQDTKTAAQAMITTLRSVYPGVPEAVLWSRLGITEMVGADDYGSGGETGPAEIFTPADAIDVTVWSWLHNIASLSFWALGRDNGNCPGQHADNCSGVVQAPWQYTHTMSTFTHRW